MKGQIRIIVPIPCGTAPYRTLITTCGLSILIRYGTVQYRNVLYRYITCFITYQQKGSKSEDLRQSRSSEKTNLLSCEADLLFDKMAVIANTCTAMVVRQHHAAFRASRAGKAHPRPENPAQKNDLFNTYIGLEL